MKNNQSCLLILSMLLGVFFVGCSDNSPAGVAAQFSNEIAEGDMKGASEFADGDTKILLGLAIGMMESMSAEEKEQMESELGEGNYSAADFTCTENGDLATCVNNVEGGEVSLVKENGEWKVSMGKEDADKE